MHCCSIGWINSRIPHLFPLCLKMIGRRLFLWEWRRVGGVVSFGWILEILQEKVEHQLSQNRMLECHNQLVEHRCDQHGVEQSDHCSTVPCKNWHCPTLLILQATTGKNLIPCQNSILIQNPLAWSCKFWNVHHAEPFASAAVVYISCQVWHNWIQSDCGWHFSISSAGATPVVALGVSL